MADESLPDSSRSRGTWWWRDWIAALLLVLGTLVAYSSSLNGEFVWDDDSWTSNVANLLHDTSGLASIWSTPEALQQYYPLTGTTFWLDHHLWGDWTLPYHVENVLLHAASALLLWALLRRLSVPGAWLAAAIFAVHPVMVESVAWITERKNVLSLFFFLAALLAYGHFAAFWQNDSRSRRWGVYVLALLFFACALLSKITAFALPAVILLLCWWKQGRIRWKEDLLPTLPFFALAVAHGLLVAWLEKHHVGTERVGLDMSWPVRCIIAGRAFWFYPGKVFWPANLCFVYPQWQIDPRDLVQWLFPISAVMVLVGAWLMRKRLGRGVATALFFYVGTLFPVLGFMNAFGMRYSYVWDHWVYVSSLGLITLVAAVTTELVARLRNPAVAWGIVAALVLSLAVLTWRQGRMYRSMITLWETTIERNPECWMAHSNLGIAYQKELRLDEALLHYRRSIELRPKFAESHTNLGVALEAQGKLDEAIAEYQAALRIDPDFWLAHRNYATALIKKGKGGEALTHLYYRDATMLPGQKNWGGMVRLAWILSTSKDAFQRNGAIAVNLALKANEMSFGKNPQVLQTLAAAYAECGKFPEAIQAAQEAMALAVNDKPLARELAAQLKGYQAGTPFRDKDSGYVPMVPESASPTGAMKK